MERRLAAVMIADVAGYGRLSQADEEGTRARFQADLHEIFEPRIAAHHGRLIKTMGDGLLVEFHSVVDALKCAIDVQRAEAERNAGLPTDRRMEFRIGINLGDVIVEGDDIHGDGVNIADRLQALADPGGAMISGTAYDHVERKLNVGYAYLGERQVKNFDKPVRAYRVLTNPDAAGKTIAGVKPPVRPPRWPMAAAAAVVLLIAAGAVAWWHPWQPQAPPSIAVLPFKDMSGDSEQGYLADGITEDLTTDLARVPGLFVVSRNAAFRYKGQDVDQAQVADELGVRYILEGSVRRVGNELRINAQLIDAGDGGHIWAERFDGAWADVFTFQDGVVQNVVNALELRLVAAKASGQVAGGTSNLAAYEEYLQGLELFWRDTPEVAAQAIQHLQKAVAADPDYGEAHAVLAHAYWRAAGNQPWEQALGSSQAELNAQSVAHLQEAMKHPSPRALQIAAEKQLNVQQHDAAIANLERAIALDPSNYDSFAWLAYALNLAGRPDAGRRYLDAALRLDPRAAEWLVPDMGFTQFSAGRFEEAAATLEKWVADHPDNTWAATTLVAAYGHLGRDAAPLIERLDSLETKAGGVAFTQLLAQARIPFQRDADVERLRDGLAKAGVPELPFGYDPKSKDRMTDAEIKSALYGHTLRGRDVDSGANWTLAFATDGSFVFSSDSRTASLTSESGSIVEIRDAVMCWGYPTTGAGGCGTLFRAPDEAAAQGNEILWISHVDRIRFAIVE
jgi:TolB-like protein/class 3 adenylate cyclase/Tfp pilus assembly protein PilF